MNVEFECVVCGMQATATVPGEASDEETLKTVRACPNCDIETIWVAY